MAGGPNAAIVMCMSCGGKAVRVYEGMEDDHYRCEECHGGFGIDWGRKQPSAPCWPPSDEEARMMKEFLAEQKVGAAIRASFPKERWSHVEALLAAYGTEPHEREVQRVRSAILQISEGEERKVEEHVATAKKDYRDVLFWADQPEQAKIGPDERKRVVAALRKLGANLPEE